MTVPLTVQFLSVNSICAAHSADPKLGKSLADRSAKTLPVVHSSNESMERFGEGKARLVSLGTPVEDADIIIASIAFANGFLVATGNIRHFSRFEGLDMLVW